MKKIELMPKVMVYSEVLDNIERIASTIKQSEDEEIQGKYYINKWQQWGHIGTSTQLKPWLFNLCCGSPINVGDLSDSYVNKGENYLLEDQNTNNYNLSLDIKNVLETERDWVKDNYLNLISNPESIAQRESLNSVRIAYKKVLLDYIKEWGLGDGLDLNSGKWVTPNIGILHHSKTPDDYAMSMTYHTDRHQFDSERGGDHFVLTVTMYLNDDYEGGELTFLNENDSDVIHYRPKAGDITVFPSAVPYFHGVERVDSGDRYLIRTFLSKIFDPSELWKKNADHYGIENYIKMEKERISLEYNSAKYFKLAVYDGDNINFYNDGHISIDKYPSSIGLPFYVKKKRGYYKY
jgi:hypothetical protein